jgi:hypothetical protein
MDESLIVAPRSSCPALIISDSEYDFLILKIFFLLIYQVQML